MKKPTFDNLFLRAYPSFKNRTISGRYLPPHRLKLELDRLDSTFSTEVAGISESGLPIYSIQLGKGPIKILAWSQMHGNESTTTKAVLDLFRLFSDISYGLEASELLEQCSLTILPMLNPDGALRYTRENVNSVDLNRDASARTQRESQVLIAVYRKVQPDFCFNLHDQRTIFSAGPLPYPASISFLAPAFNEERSLNPSRIKAMKIIATVNSTLQQQLPSQVGRFNDSFNINCTGDHFQALGTPTILFEAGHIHKDYSREESRKYMALAIYEAIRSICHSTFEEYTMAAYLSIPENVKNYFDIIVRNVAVGNEIKEIALQYRESLEENRIKFQPVIQLIDSEIDFFGHQVIDWKGAELKHPQGKELIENDIVPSILLNLKEISFKIE